MEVDPPIFTQIEVRRLLEKTPVSRLAWALDMQESQIMKWMILVPRLESQYIRESCGCKHQVNRRVIRKTTAIALFANGLEGLDEWIKKLNPKDTLNYEGSYLSEYHSLLIEYATKGAIKGISIKTIVPHKSNLIH